MEGVSGLIAETRGVVEYLGEVYEVLHGSNAAIEFAISDLRASERYLRGIAEQGEQAAPTPKKGGEPARVQAAERSAAGGAAGGGWGAPADTPSGGLDVDSILAKARTVLTVGDSPRDKAWGGGPGGSGARGGMMQTKRRPLARKGPTPPSSPAPPPAPPSPGLPARAPLTPAKPGGGAGGGREAPRLAPPPPSLPHDFRRSVSHHEAQRDGRGAQRDLSEREVKAALRQSGRQFQDGLAAAVERRDTGAGGRRAAEEAGRAWHVHPLARRWVRLAALVEAQAQLLDCFRVLRERSAGAGAGGGGAAERWGGVHAVSELLRLREALDGEAKRVEELEACEAAGGARPGGGSGLAAAGGEAERWRNRCLRLLLQGPPSPPPPPPPLPRGRDPEVWLPVPCWERQGVPQGDEGRMLMPPAVGLQGDGVLPELRGAQGACRPMEYSSLDELLALGRLRHSVQSNALHLDLEGRVAAGLLPGRPAASPHDVAQARLAHALLLGACARAPCAVARVPQT